MEFYRIFLLYTSIICQEKLWNATHTYNQKISSIRIKHIKSKIGRRLSANILSFAEITPSFITECRTNFTNIHKKGTKMNHGIFSIVVPMGRVTL